MRWETALAAANRIEAHGGLAASQLSYHYLGGGPALLAEWERSLRLTVASIPDGDEMPRELGRDLVAWGKTTAMAQRRLAWDLPSAWSTPSESGSP